MQPLSYRSHPKLQISDHKPVSSLFNATVSVYRECVTITAMITSSLSPAQLRVVVPSKEKEVLEQVTWRLDKLENDTLPQVDLSTLEVSGLIEYKLVSRELL